MRKCLMLAVFVSMALGSVATAQAGWVIEGSVGKGARVTEPRGLEPTNVMGVVGYQFLAMFRPELGLVADLGDVKNREFDLQLRPMFGIYPPILPLYARAIFLVQNLLHDVKVGVGAAGGIKIGLPLIGLAFFAEAGVLPRFESDTVMVIEGRAGAYWAF